MKVIADTNVLLRISIRDDLNQARFAEEALRQATFIVISLPTICELAWVLKRGYRQNSAQIAHLISSLLTIRTVRIDRASVEAGLTMLEAGGDFADGVIAYEGRRLGGETYLTFDKKAARLIESTGGKAHLLPSVK